MKWTPAFQAFVEQHLDDDPERLLLSAHRYPDVDVPAAVRQIKVMRKLREKAPDWARPDLHFPLALSAEQASSAVTAHFKSTLVKGRNMADLTGGMGIDVSFYAQTFEHCVYVEQNAELAAAANHNFDLLGFKNIQVMHAEASDFLKSGTTHFDLIYLDPARRDAQANRVFQLEDCSPDVLSLKEILLSRASWVLIKAAPMLDLTAAMRALGNIQTVWVVAVKDEVKELLFLLKNGDGKDVEKAPIHVVNLESRQAEFVFSKSEEVVAKPALSLPGKFIYEPNAALLKAGAFKSVAIRYGLQKLHANTHLYTSDPWVADFPGRQFEAIAQCRYDRKALQMLLPEGKANVAARNFPDSVAQIRKKLHLAEGGETYIFAVTDVNGNKTLILCKKTNPS